MIKRLLPLLLGALLLSAQEATDLPWSTFERLKFTEVYVEEVDSWLPVAEWTNDILALEGKRYRMTGYVIALDVLNNSYALSAYPFSACFFCGAAGPESVMNLELAKESEFITDEVRTFEGVLKLSSDPMEFPLNLEEAVLIE